MIIHLFRNGTGMIIGHNSRTVTTVPDTIGTLTLGDTTVHVDGITEMPTENIYGIKLAKFVSDTGKIYNIGMVSVKPSSTISNNAESDTVIGLLHKTDELEEKYEGLLDKYQKLKAKVEYDSIGFITGEDQT